MKKLRPLALIALAACLFTSCKKDYTCTCKITTSGTTITQPVTYPKTTKSKAQEACDLAQKTYTNATTSTTATCSL